MISLRYQRWIVLLLLGNQCIAEVDPVLLQRAVLTAPQTAALIDRIYRSDFSDAVIQCVQAPGHCDVIASGQFVNLDFTGQNMAGQRVCLQDHIFVYLRNLQGESGNPALVSNCGGVSRITDSNKALWVRSSRHVRITGTGHGGHALGLRFQGASNTVDITAGSSDIEIDHVEVSNVLVDGVPAPGAGIAVRTYPACVNQTLQYTRPGFTQYNTVVRDSFVHDTGSEGLYIGTSHHHLPNGFAPLDCDGDGTPEPTPQANLEGVTVARNVLWRIGADGIQIGAAINQAVAEHNVVLDFGLHSSWPHVQGFEINPGSLLQVQHNWVETRFPQLSGAALSIQGAGGSVYINNMFVGMYKAMLALRNTGPSDAPHRIWFNTFALDGSDYAADVWCNNEVSENHLDFANNLFVNSQQPWVHRQFGASNCWTEIGQWFADDVNALGLADPAGGHWWPLSGSPLQGQGVLTDPVVPLDFSNRARVTIEPGAYALRSN